MGTPRSGMKNLYEHSLDDVYIFCAKKCTFMVDNCCFYNIDFQ